MFINVITLVKLFFRFIQRGFVGFKNLAKILENTAVNFFSRATKE